MPSPFVVIPFPPSASHWIVYDGSWMVPEVNEVDGAVGRHIPPASLNTVVTLSIFVLQVVFHVSYCILWSLVLRLIVLSRQERLASEAVSRTTAFHLF